MNFFRTLILFLACSFMANAQTLKYPEKDCDGASATPDGLHSWCHDDVDDYYNECDCRFETAVKEYEAQKKKIQDQISDLYAKKENIRDNSRSHSNTGQEYKNKLAEEDNDNFDNDKARALAELIRAKDLLQQALAVEKKIQVLRDRLSVNGSADRRGIEQLESAIENSEAEIAFVREMEARKTLTLTTGNYSSYGQEESEDESQNSYSDTSSETEEEENSSSKEIEKQKEAEASEAEKRQREAEREYEQALERQRQAERQQLREQERRRLFEERKQRQNRENERIAAASAASTASFMFLLGGFIYHNYGWSNPEDLYTGSNIYLNMDGGYSLGFLPMYFASEYEHVDGYTNKTKSSANITADLNVGLKLGYDHSYGGGYGFVDVGAGVSPIFSSSQFNHAYGARAFGGLKNIQLFGEFRKGHRDNNVTNFLDSKEAGEGKSNFDYENRTIGVKFSWYGRPLAPARNHLFFGLIEEKFTHLSSEQGIQSIETEPANLFSSDEKAYTGYLFEWRHDHHGYLFFKVFPKYPLTGMRGGSPDDSINEDGHVFVQLGFLRSLSAFY